MKYSVRDHQGIETIEAESFEVRDGYLCFFNDEGDEVAVYAVGWHRVHQVKDAA